MSIGLGAADINDMLDQWKKTPDGGSAFQGYADAAIQNAINSGKKIDGIATKKEMIKSAQEMIRLLKEAAAAMNLPRSVMDHFSSLGYTQPYYVKGQGYCIDIYFGDDLGRRSLYESKYPEGVDNIIALYNNGYDASAHVYGWWDGHDVSPTAGPDVTYRSAGVDGSVWVPSRKSLVGGKFIQDAVMQFMAKYGAQYGCILEISPEYTGSTN